MLLEATRTTCGLHFVDTTKRRYKSTCVVENKMYKNITGEGRFCECIIKLSKLVRYIHKFARCPRSGDDLATDNNIPRVGD